MIKEGLQIQGGTIIESLSHFFYADTDVHQSRMRGLHLSCCWVTSYGPGWTVGFRVQVGYQNLKRTCIPCHSTQASWCGSEVSTSSQDSHLELSQAAKGLRWQPCPRPMHHADQMQQHTPKDSDTKQPVEVTTAAATDQMLPKPARTLLQRGRHPLSTLNHSCFPSPPGNTGHFEGSTGKRGRCAVSYEDAIILRDATLSESYCISARHHCSNIKVMHTK